MNIQVGHSSCCSRLVACTTQWALIIIIRTFDMCPRGSYARSSLKITLPLSISCDTHTHTHPRVSIINLSEEKKSFCFGASAVRKCVALLWPSRHSEWGRRTLQPYLLFPRLSLFFGRFFYFVLPNHSYWHKLWKQNKAGKEIEFKTKKKRKETSSHTRFIWSFPKRSQSERSLFVSKCSF